MIKQKKMASYFYKKISVLVLLSILLQSICSATVFGARTLWPSTMNLYNDAVNLDAIIATTTTVSDNKKGFLLTGDPREVFYLDASHIAINVTLSGKGHTLFQYLDGLKKRGVDITVIIINDKVPVGTDMGLAHSPYNKPYCYLLDFYANNGEWQKGNFQRIVEDYSPYADNWIIGNEVNSQMYGYAGPMKCYDYTEKMCKTFKECYDMIKAANKDADVYLSFDQAYNMPAYNSKHKDYNAKESNFHYNFKEQLEYINELLPKEVDWGVALHPYPAPVESAKFWDDDYAGFDEMDNSAKKRPYLITLKNFEVAIAYLADKKFLRKDGTLRNIIISEFGLTSKDGEEIQAAALYFLWEKIKDNPFIKFFLYNAQTDLADDYHFGLVTLKDKKRLSWAVFKDMDKPFDSQWCKDLLDRVLAANKFRDENGILIEN